MVLRPIKDQERSIMSNFKCEPDSSQNKLDLGMIFFEVGARIPKEFGSDEFSPESAIWFALGAIQGNLAAQTNLGLMLTVDNIVPKSLDLGLDLLRAVADTGDKNAQEAVYFLTTSADEYRCECCRKLEMN